MPPSNSSPRGKQGDDGEHTIDQPSTFAQSRREFILKRSETGVDDYDLIGNLLSSCLVRVRGVDFRMKS